MDDNNEKPRHRGHDGRVVRHRSAPGKVQVFCFLLGTWRCVYSDDDRVKAEEWARENVRREGSAVSAIELRERGNGSVVIWRAEAGD